MFSCQETKPAFSMWPSVSVTVNEIEVSGSIFDIFSSECTLSPQE